MSQKVCLKVPKTSGDSLKEIAKVLVLPSTASGSLMFASPSAKKLYSGDSYIIQTFFRSSVSLLTSTWDRLTSSITFAWFHPGSIMEMLTTF